MSKFKLNAGAERLNDVGLNLGVDTSSSPAVNKELNGL